MSRTHEEELIHHGVRAVNAGDVEAIAALAGPDAEYEMVGGFADIVGQPVLKGPAGVRRFYADWFALFTTTLVEPTELIPAGDDRILLLACVEVTTEHSAAPVRMEIGQIYTFKDGCIHHVASYYDPQEARAAAGLPAASG